MKDNFIIIHGSFSTPFMNWFPWLSRELTKNNKSVIVPQFPIGIGYQNYENWSKLLKYYLDLGYINETTTLIGHSISPIFICKFLIENKINVSKLIFVSGFNNYINPELANSDYDKVNESFYLNNLTDIHKFCDDITCIYSNNDPYVPFSKLEEFASLVGDKTMVIENGGHLNSETGYTKFQELINILK